MDIRSPLIVQFEITDKCNLFCNYCYRFDTEKIRESFDLDDKKIMKIAERIAKAGVFEVILTGGEPFIRKNLVLKLVEFFKKQNISVNINTNLLLVDEDTISKLAKLRHNGFLVSCSTTDPELYKEITNGGSFEKLKQNIKLIQKYGFDCSISMVITKKNITHIRQTASDLKELGITMFNVTPMSLNLENPRNDLLISKEEVQNVIKDLIWVENNLGLVTDVLEPLPSCVLPAEAFFKNYNFAQRKCNAGITTAGISSNGDVRPCNQNPYSYGNILRESLIDIFAKMTDWRDGSHFPDKCKQCTIACKCGAGCRINAWAYDNDKKGVGPWFVEEFKYNPYKNLEKECKRINKSINQDTILTFNNNCKWRKEGKDSYLVSIGSNMFFTNKHIIKLISVLRQALPLKYNEISHLLKVDGNNDKFINDIVLLSNNNVIIPRVN